MKSKNKYISSTAEKNVLISRRSLLLTIGKAGIFVVIASRLAYLQLYKHSNYKSLSDDNRITHRLLEPSRGLIYDINGTPIALNIESYRASIILEEISDINITLRSLNDILPEKKINLNETIKKINKSKKFVPIQVVDDLSWDQFSKLNSNIYRLEGIIPSVGYKRYYPNKESLAHLVGYVADISKEEIYSNPFYKLNHAKSGKIGIEKSFDKYLRGKLGSKGVEINAYGREVRELTRIEGEVGKNIQLTIDSELQEFCFKQLKDISGSISITDIETGGYAALATSPSFDPNKFYSGFNQEEWNKLLNDKHKPLINKTISSYYPPGSTIKPLVALAGLESGIDPTDIFFCNGKHEIIDTSLESGIKTFHCWKKGGHGKVNMTHAIKVSCDVYFYQMARKIGINKIAEVCRRFGLGEDVFDVFFEEKSGVVPDKKWKQETLGKSWLIGETLVSAIGQSYFLTTSAQLSLAIAQLVNGGRKLKPSIIYQEPSKDTKFPKILASQPHLDIIKKALIKATNTQGGTSYRSRLTGENKMAGKTGTSQVRRISKKEREEGLIKNKDLPWNKRDHALFVGYGPVNKARYALSIIVEHGGSGSGTAAPIASKVFKYLFKEKLFIKRKDLKDV